ncbi:glycoside hydrolase family 16 protein [Halalkalirubrum salinum]|uniref:glycoside hydrolase family 16 protein n=1 Tax=Halalkalirubrum salinum TaxID=2563889 RepID=UPI0010FB079B|nr:family 16 glycosylhydrolase [Halalkalirubrum salinum]
MIDQSTPRRRLLSTLGSIGVVGLAGCTTDDRDQSADPDGDWEVIVDETWESFDTDRWAVGFIDREAWIPDDDAAVSDEHVMIEDGTCVLRIESEGAGPDGCYQGVINASVGGEPWHPDEGIAIDPSPPVYVEATMQLPGRVGILPAFWMHPADTTWPPEIDVVELFQDGSSNERETLNADVHWSDSGHPGDQSTHRHDPIAHQTGRDLTATMNTYGCAWFEDRIEWYFNGGQIATQTLSGSQRACLTADDARPFSLVFSNHVNRIGEADLSAPWVEELRIDRVRVLKKRD